MRAGYKVTYSTLKTDTLLVVSNLHPLNEVYSYSCEDEIALNILKDESDIGFWRIKRKETIKAK